MNLKLLGGLIVLISIAALYVLPMSIVGFGFVFGSETKQWKGYNWAGIAGTMTAPAGFNSLNPQSPKWTVTDDFNLRVLSWKFLTTNEGRSQPASGVRIRLLKDLNSVDNIKITGGVTAISAIKYNRDVSCNSLSGVQVVDVTSSGIVAQASQTLDDLDRGTPTLMGVYAETSGGQQVLNNIEFTKTDGIWTLRAGDKVQSIPAPSVNGRYVLELVADTLANSPCDATALMQFSDMVVVTSSIIPSGELSILPVPEVGDSVFGRIDSFAGSILPSTSPVGEPSTPFTQTYSFYGVIAGLLVLAVGLVGKR